MKYLLKERSKFYGSAAAQEEKIRRRTSEKKMRRGKRGKETASKSPAKLVVGFLFDENKNSSPYIVDGQLSLEHLSLVPILCASSSLCSIGNILLQFTLSRAHTNENANKKFAENPLQDRTRMCRCCWLFFSRKKRS